MFHFVSEFGRSPLESLYVDQVLVVLLGSQRFPDVVTALQLVRWGKGPRIGCDSFTVRDGGLDEPLGIGYLESSIAQRLRSRRFGSLAARYRTPSKLDSTCGHEFFAAQYYVILLTSLIKPTRLKTLPSRANGEAGRLVRQ